MRKIALFVTALAGVTVFAGAAWAQPVNDDCADAILLDCNTVTEGTTEGATVDPKAGECNGITVGAPGVWYKVVGTGEDIQAYTCADEMGYDTKLHVYKGGCDVLTCVTANDDGCPMPNTKLSRVTWKSKDGVEYLILVNGFEGATGPFDLTVICCVVPDCNRNCVPDECDISCSPPGCEIFPRCGKCPDCDGNGEPDECQGDPFEKESGVIDLPIPDDDPDGVSHTINLPDLGPIADVNVYVYITHTFIGDLTIDVKHNDITVRLWDQQCGSNVDLEILFDDEGEPVVCATPTVGRFQPVQDLDVYDFEEVVGDWTLTVADHSPGDIGTLVKWGVSGTLRPFPCCTGVLIESDPPDGAIDAREEHEAEHPENLTGLTSFVLLFDDDTSIVRQCFSVEETGAVPPPEVIGVEKLGGNQVRVNYDRPITVQEWTTLTYRGVGGPALTDVGFLPGDVNQSRRSTGRDISELIDCLNDVIVCALYQTDMNRSGDPNGNDITALIDILQVSVPYPRAWLNEEIVPEPNP